VSARGWLIGCILVAGCGEDTAPAPPAPKPGTDAPSTEPRRTLGQTSTLSASTSPLSGAVTGFSVTVTDTATIVALAADTLFAFDRADLTPDAQAGLQRTADTVRAGGPGAVTVTGHSDAKGDDAYNLALSQRRAQAVADWLRQQPGLGDRVFEVAGRGETMPVAANSLPDGSDAPDGRARNRRVEISVPR
jgi:outer membrane protein OmpA-like peptidoglycan-associated protein